MEKQHFERIKIEKQELEWIYVPDVEYCERDGIKRRMQMIVPYRHNWESDERFPVLMFHGTDDPLVSVKHGRSLFEHLKQTDKTVEYYEVEGETHGGGSWWGKEILDIVEKFIRRNQE